MANLHLLGTEVIPQVRKIGDDLGLKSPFEADLPVSLQTGKSARI
jgi:hypothetical protein